MYIRVTTGRFDPTRRADIERWSRDRLAPALKEAPGFKGYHGGVDSATSRLVAISLWETRAQADTLHDSVRALIPEVAAMGVELDPGQAFEEIISI
jgi:hypothetical protein